MINEKWKNEDWFMFIVFFSFSYVKLCEYVNDKNRYKKVKRIRVIDFTLLCSLDMKK